LQGLKVLPCISGCPEQIGGLAGVFHLFLSPLFYPVFEYLARLMLFACARITVPVVLFLVVVVVTIAY
jgi:hypothetical protein